MPNAKDLSELRAMLMKQMSKAMQVVQKKAEADMYEETGDFYTGGKPKKYIRTGALGDTPRVTALSKSGNSVSFNAYLDTNYQYTTGSKPYMEEVLDLANEGTQFATKNYFPATPTVGKQGFWDRAQDKMRDTFNNTMEKFFE